MRKFLNFITVAVLLLAGYEASAQITNPTTDNPNISYDTQGRPMRKGNSKGDTLAHRDPSEDSITISYRYFDSSRSIKMDSSVNDFYSVLPIPFTYTNLGNIGSPANSLLFKPTMYTGWDEGIHSMDPYRFTLESTRYFTTTRPYTSLGYEIGSKNEQLINVLHTQNRSSKVNFTFEFKLINSPGAYRNQNTNVANMRFNVASQSRDKRYTINIIYFQNSLKASVNGGLIDPNDLNNVALGDIFSIPTKLANGAVYNNNPFSTGVSTGNIFTDKTLYLRHSYDFGQKDSIVENDTVRQRMFYPRLRLQHSFQYANYSYEYIDANPVTQNYLDYFNYIAASDTILFKDRWQELTNEFAIYTYPDKKNSAQFLKLYGSFQSLLGQFGNGFNKTFNNVFAGAEYRNRTRNQKWEIEAAGKLYATGSYAGNYSALISLQRNLGSKLGYFQIGFNNINRAPAFIYSGSGGNALSFNPADTGKFTAHTNFPVITNGGTLSNENVSRIFAKYNLPALGLELSGNYYLYTNYTYFDNYFTVQQSSTPFNYLQLGLSKETKLSKYFKWYIDLYLQQKAGGVPINLPSAVTRNRIAFEGNFFRNLFLATGLDVRYYTPYKYNNYSPFTGQFFYQDSIRSANKPDISFYLNFRITRFRFFGQVDNLNTFISKGSSKYNFVAPNYPDRGLWIRYGFVWMFVN
ncbi:MAG: putative porin [Chitinophagaceae bacterium]|jgi:hypothetical protein|nr:putative porin [Chitinophagaceae bacterium]